MLSSKLKTCAKQPKNEGKYLSMKSLNVVEKHIGIFLFEKNIFHLQTPRLLHCSPTSNCVTDD